jgi:glycosyltransferase involved in cell wall biosynthesis
MRTVKGAVMPKVSVVIPCYNHGRYLDEAIDSVLAQTFDDFEIVVVDDGSTDAFTIDLLKGYHREKTRVLRTVNMGLAAARNNGIAAAGGQYILPLDADDRIEPTYLEQAVAVLDGDPQVAIVYCRARLFGAVESEWLLPEYTLERMLLDNVIFCSAVFRRSDWTAIGGYDPGMVYGWEDYDFWLGIIERGGQVVRIPEILFCYRVASDSMVRSREKWQKVEMFRRIFRRHQQLFADNIGVWLENLVDVRDRYYSSRLYVDCGAGISDETSVVRKIDAGTRVITFDLSTYSGIVALRFDPVDTWAVLEFGAITLEYDRQQPRRLTEIASNALYCREGMLFFDTSDPQCFFPTLSPPDYRGLKRVTVELRFAALAEAALQRLVALQKEQLQRIGKVGGTKKMRHVGDHLLRSFFGTRR